MISFAGNCNCGTLNALNCIAPMLINNNTIEVDGMFIGCLPLTSLLHSSLSCFYNATCLLRLQTTLQLDLVAPTLNLSTLNSTSNSRFSSNTPLSNIVNALMIETWNLNIDYPSYFHQCNVASCTYTYLQRNNIIIIVTKIIGVCKHYSFSKLLLDYHCLLILDGGMTVVLRIAAPLFVKIGLYTIGIIRKHRERNENGSRHSCC